ncbi:HNH endonuclease [Nakamurella sp.]|uniref:HNH endonuclease n=1 Tax=Nakamurella sp. TaxID=1869182 RepID=UPI0037831D9C
MRRTMTPGNGEPERPAVELHPVMTDRTLADRDDEPAHLIGHGPVPAAISRDLLTADERTRVWVRRLFTDPGTGDLLAADARRRDFPDTARQFLAARDQICRTPWCGAPIRHADHAVAVSRGGPTDLRNGNGRCTACNLVKDLDGWTTHVDDTGVITTTTPTGHAHHSRPLRPPTSPPWKPRQSPGPGRPPARPPLRIEIHWPAEKFSRRVSRSSPLDP